MERGPHADFAPVFVAGFHRSGTTLLAAMLGRHPGLVATPETHFADEVAPRPVRRGRVITLREGHAAMVDRLFTCARTIDLGLERDALLRRFAGLPADYPTLFRTVLEAYAQSRGGGRVVEKTPAHLPHLPLLLRWYPAAKAVIVVRDGRDAVRSLMRAPWSHTNLRRHGRTWRWCVARGLQCERRHPERVLHVRFEDLLAEPEATLARVNAFIGVPYDAAQLDPGVATGVVPRWEREWKGKADAAPDASRAGAWRREAPPDEMRIMNSMMGPALRRMGYHDTRLEGCGPLCRAREWVFNAAHLVLYHPAVKPAFAAIKRLLWRLGLPVALENIPSRPGEDVEAAWRRQRGGAERKR